MVDAQRGVFVPVPVLIDNQEYPGEEALGQALTHNQESPDEEALISLLVKFWTREGHHDHWLQQRQYFDEADVRLAWASPPT